MLLFQVYVTHTIYLFSLNNITTNSDIMQPINKIT